MVLGEERETLSHHLEGAPTIQILWAGGMTNLGKARREVGKKVVQRQHQSHRWDCNSAWGDK